MSSPISKHEFFPSNRLTGHGVLEAEGPAFETMPVSMALEGSKTQVRRVAQALGTLAALLREHVELDGTVAEVSDALAAALTRLRRIAEVRTPRQR